MQQLPKISVVVPVYQVEQYLPQCVESVLQQDYDRYELILVEDGSPDQCGALCDAYASRYAQVRALHKPNGGLSDARNAGTEAATGDYLIYLDSDDYWERPCALRELAQLAAETQAELILFGFRRHNLKTGADVPLRLEEYGGPQEGAAQKLSLLSQRKYCNSAWSKLIGTELLRREALSFPVGLRSEDLAWSRRLLCAARRIVLYTPNVLVYQTGRGGSITTRFTEKDFSDIAVQLKEDMSRIRQQPDAALRRVGEAYWAEQLCWILAYLPELGRDGCRRALEACRPYLSVLDASEMCRAVLVRRCVRVLGAGGTVRLLHWYLKHKGLFHRA